MGTLRDIGLAAAAMLASIPAGATPSSPAGLWMSPHKSVVVETGACGDKLCGRIVWANGEAQGDARDAGVEHLVGTVLLQDYRPTGDGRWKGTVFVPDMAHSFASEIDTVSPEVLRVKGCILGGLLCKSQLWTRIASVPRD